MYGDPWRLYVYRSYGMHFCANVVTGPTEEASAVLIRAGEVVDGIEIARKRRPAVKDVALARGPGNLTRALDLSLEDLGTDLLTADGVRLGERADGYAATSAQVPASACPRPPTCRGDSGSLAIRPSRPTAAARAPDAYLEPATA